MVVGVERHESICQAIHSHSLCQGAGRMLADSAAVLVPPAQHGLHDHQRHRVRVSPGCTLEGHSHGALGGIREAVMDVRPSELGHILGDECLHAGSGVLVGHTRERFAGKLDKLVMVHSASGCQHHAWPTVVCLHVSYELLPCQRLDVLHWPQDGAAQGRELKGCGMQVVKHQLGCLLVYLLHFAQDHSPLLLDRLLIKV
mmetsp:Transcript_16787/g.28784  ORF Transcript_16787/g.28784 Transcript_16787/m.28784 type:complete len:200 (+) Transcript_16787:617-1216(+)